MQRSRIVISMGKEPVLTSRPALKSKVSPPGTTRPNNKPVSANTKHTMSKKPPHSIKPDVSINSIVSVLILYY